MSEAMLAPLARWVASFDPAVCDARASERLFATMLDWAGALGAGAGHPLYSRYLAALCPIDVEIGPCSVISHAQRRPLQTAASINAGVGHFWEVDDAHRTSTSHPGITVIPVTIALGEAFPATPKSRLRGGVIAGYEAITRIGSFLGKEHYARCHTTATAGCFGAAAAAAHVLGLGAAETLSAFGHAGTQAAGLWQLLDDGATEAKAFHAAIAVRSGLAAAFMARAGIGGAEHILEGQRGLLAAWHLDGEDPSLLIPGSDLMIHDITIKGWPVCGQMHSALDCARALAGESSLRTEEIEKVLVEVPQSCLDIASNVAPKTVDAAKFSTSFCIAAVLSGRPPSFQNFDAALLTDHEISQLEGCIEVRAEPAFTERFPQERPARVSVTLVGGRTVSHECAFRRGDPELPWSETELIDRAKNILRHAPGDPDFEGVVQWCRAFADVGDPEWCASQIFTLMGCRSDGLANLEKVS